MPILSGDVKLLESSVMADVPEGGGAPTGNAIADGVSNAIFPDISELDRAGGRVNLRKTFVSIQTDDTDSYFGANIIVAEPPADPRVSVTLFTNESTFDTRDSAKTRIESYLNRGTEWAGFLFENHITGQRAVQILQRPQADLPNVGQTLVLVQNEGASNEKSQYVRTTAVSATSRLFYDTITNQDYTASIVTCDISDALRYDFTGSSANRSFTRSATGTKIRDTLVADAGTYVGVVPLTSPAHLGDFSVSADSIYTQLVPSAQTETPIADVRSNGISTALVKTGSPVTLSLSLTFTTTQAMYLGGAVLPATLSMVRSGITVTDAGGKLMSAGVEVGQIDYENGIATLTTNVFGAGGGTYAVTFTPAAVPELITSQLLIRVTPESRSLSYAFTLEDIPTPKTLTLSYLAQGRWYVLRDDGAGKLVGSDTAFGIGTLSYTTGSVVATLGALPDVGSGILLSYFSESSTVNASNTTLLNDGKVYIPINTSAQLSEEPGAKPIAIGGLSLSWTHGGAAKTATDDGHGNLTGDGTGSVDYTQGVVRLTPNVLPAAGSTILMDFDGAVPATFPLMGMPTDTIPGGDVVEGSVRIPTSIQYTYNLNLGWTKLSAAQLSFAIVIYDRGGHLYFHDPGSGAEIACGTIDYALGTYVVTVTPTVGPDDQNGPHYGYTYWPGLYQGQTFATWNNAPVGYRSREAAISMGAVTVTVANTLPGPSTISVNAASLSARVRVVPNYVLRAVRLKLGTHFYTQLANDSLARDVSPTTGSGTLVGNVVPAAGTILFSDWETGALPVISEYSGLLVPPTVGVEAPFSAFYCAFRTAASPLRPGSFSVLGTMQDGTNFNVTAGTDGKINGTRVKGLVDYEYGLVELYFVNPAGSADLHRDFSFLGIGGVATLPQDLAMVNSIRYNAVSYSYLPLDADLLGIDPVRLPSDGRVPIFRAGGFAVVGHTGKITATVSNGQTIDCGRVRLSRIRVVGHDGVVINTGYSTELDAGTVTFTSVTGYSQPVTIQHRIEDMAVVREAQINGELAFTRQLTHDFPLGSFVSSALIAGDLFSRVSLIFDQATWSGAFQDILSGSAATATFNHAQFPIVVSNRGAMTERWALQFTGTTQFNIIGENVGVIGTGTTAATSSPINPATNVPYFTVPTLGWGTGWVAGNVLRFNTIGAQFPVWVVRTVQQGPESVPDDQFTLLIRGDVDAP